MADEAGSVPPADTLPGAGEEAVENTRRTRASILIQATYRGHKARGKTPGKTLSMNVSLAVALAASKLKKGRALLHSEPLLKFHHNEDGTEEPFLDPHGLGMIRRLTGKICPIVFIGDGRAGKSYLASRLVGTHEAFVSSDSAESVTEGIDIAVATLQAGREGEPKVNLLVMDCEGGNNAMAAIRNLVNVFAVVACTQVVFVSNSMMSEAALDALATAMAARQLVQFDESISPPRRLTFVVNKTTLKYEGDALEKTLSSSKDASRAETRNGIKETFADRQFVAVKLSQMTDFEDDVQRYLQLVREGATPLTVGGAPVTGEQLCLLLEVVRSEVTKQSSVSAPSIMRGVVLDGFLVPLRQRLFVDAIEQLPKKLDDYIVDLPQRDVRANALRKFDQKTAHLSQKDLVAEARDSLSQALEKKWEELVHQNEIFGEQISYVRTEHREVVQKSEQVPLGGLSLLKELSTRREHVRVESRSVTIKKKGGEGIASDWEVAATEHARLVDQGLRDGLDSVPRMQGHVRHRAPGGLDRMCGMQMGLHAYMILTDLHLMWWYGPNSMDSKPDQCFCLLQKTQVSLVADDTDRSRFTVKNHQDGSSFQFESDAADARRWADAFGAHSELAVKAAPCFPDPNLPGPPCLYDLKERNMQDILRPSDGSCAERCTRFVLRLPSGQAPASAQPTVARGLSGAAQSPAQVEMAEAKRPLASA